MGYFRFLYTQTGLFTALYITLCIKQKLTKNPLNYYSLKVTKFHADSDKIESARTKKTIGTPPPACLVLKAKIVNGRSLVFIKLL